MPTVVEMWLYPEDKEAVTEEDEGRTPPLPEWYESLPKWMRSKTLSLGLDLQGGLMLRYSVDIDSAIDDKLSSNAANIRSQLAGMGKSVQAVTNRELNEVHIQFESAEDTKLITTEFLYDYPMLTVAQVEGSLVKLSLREGFFKEAEESAVQQAVEIIRDRIDGLGVAQPTVRVEAGRNIAVELPGLSRKRVAAAEQLISTTAVLTFKLVADQNESIDLFTNLSTHVTEGSGIYKGRGTLRADDVVDPSSRRIITSGKDILKKFVRDNETLIPGGREIVFEKIDLRERKTEVADDVDVASLPTSWRIRLVRTDLPPLSGENVETAYPASNPDTGMPYVSLKLDRTGGDTFQGITKDNIGKQLAILMDDVLVSDPVIRSEIPGGNVSIEMGRGNRQETMNEVNNLVVSLRSGALPAPIRQEYKTLVGPSLGQDSIESGMESLAIGFVLVFVFMCIYYQGSGIIAAFALLCNILFILAGMASMGAALTMPGIAGIVLTVGMSVDSNVIIFERIREEMRQGETPRKAIFIGYDKALWTILDSNITTAVAAIVLMNFGSGPVKGFAITLLLGIISTVYTAFFVTKTIFESRVHGNVEKLSI
ncbi:MAG: protein translocase subunit SecD [Proteobacteria bacterium]|nr:protein translocase subunit SecD [Pseudomonadota bacterium]MBQ9241938.1 protein translocase subunit SecD [Pseudomonadota bacterium]